MSRRRPSRSRRTRVITLPQLLSTAVESDPDGLAVVLADADGTLAELTYAELDERSTRLARLLIARGIGPEDLVAVAFPRSLEAVIALWAVAKSGAGFVPVDPHDPAQRIAHLVVDSGVVLGLTVAAARDRLPGTTPWLTVDTAEFALELEKFAADPVTYADRLRPLRAEHPAYVVYTIDAIGAPSGVVVTQAGLSVLCDAQRARHRSDGDSRTLSFAAPADDASVLELLLAVGGAATMVVAAPTVHTGAGLAALLLREEVTHAYLPPDVLEEMEPSGLDELRVVICSGRSYPPELVDRWTRPIGEGPFGAAVRRFLHGYGAAETTVLTNLAAPYSAAEAREIGAPNPGITEYVLDQQLSPIAEGETGELYVAGPQLARGYLGRPGPTAAHFVANPFLGSPEGAGLSGADARLFRTGDLVRRISGGGIEYIGPASPVMAAGVLSGMPNSRHGDGGSAESDNAAAGVVSEDISAEATTIFGPVVPNDSGEYIVPQWNTDAGVNAAAAGYSGGASYVSPEADDSRAVDDSSDRHYGHGGNYEIGWAGSDRVDTLEPAAGPVSRSVDALGEVSADSVVRPFVPEFRSAERQSDDWPVDFADGEGRAASDATSDDFAAAEWSGSAGLPGEKESSDETDSTARQPDTVESPGSSEAAVGARGDGNVLAVADPPGRAAGDQAAPSAAAEPDIAGEPAIPLTVMPRPEVNVPFADTEFPGVPLSAAQERMWRINRDDPDTAAHNVCFAVRISGRMRVEALQVAVVDVIERHEMLRTAYPVSGDDGYQIVLPLDRVLADLNPEPIDDTEIEDWLGEYARIAFDAGTEIPVRIGIAQIAEDDHVVVVVAHRIAADEASVTPFLRDLAVALLARRNRAKPSWGPLAVQYADYALWQRTVLGDGADPDSVAAREIDYWRRTLADIEDVSGIPADRPRPAVASKHGAAYTFTVDREVHSALVAEARAAGGTLFTALHAGFAALLARLSGSSDIVVGATDSGRHVRELDSAIGLFANTLALRTRIDPTASFTELLTAVNRDDKAAFAHARLPFGSVAEALGYPGREHPSWLRTGLTVREHDRSQVDLPGLSATAVEFDTDVAEFELRLEVLPRTEHGAPAGLSATFTYATELFDEITVAGFAERLVLLLTAVAADPRRAVGDIELLQPDERMRILGDWNNTRYPVEPGLLLDGYHRAVRAHPDVVAVSGADTELTYAEFDGRVNQLARLLISRGVGPETAVVVGIRPSLDLLVAVYAVLTAGGAYVPVDPDHPAEWIGHILDTVRPVCVIGTGADPVPVPPDTQVLRYDTAELTVFDTSPVRPEELSRPPLPANPAYVLFTSGASGRPNGVAVSHAAIDHQLAWMLAAYPLANDDVYLQKTPPTCDASLWGYFLPLRAGARLRLAAPGRSDPLYIAESIIAHGVTVTDFVPSELAGFAARTAPGICPTLREVFVIGEVLPAHVVTAFQRISDARVHNLYGPTETTVSVTYWPAASADGADVPIGLPQWNTRVYVLDDRLRPVPVGVPGELYLAGAALARGYVNRPDLTADRFVADPFSEDDGGARMYRTGDLVVWRESSGELPARLDYVGRNDFRINLHGRRIEPGEVETALRAQSSVADAVVVARDERLVAYVEPRPQMRILTERVAASLAEVLPEELIPDVIVPMDALPRTGTGAFDRRALPDPSLGVETSSSLKVVRPDSLGVLRPPDAVPSESTSPDPAREDPAAATESGWLSTQWKLGPLSEAGSQAPETGGVSSESGPRPESFGAARRNTGSLRVVGPDEAGAMADTGPESDLPSRTASDLPSRRGGSWSPRLVSSDDVDHANDFDHADDPSEGDGSESNSASLVGSGTASGDPVDEDSPVLSSGLSSLRAGYDRGLRSGAGESPSIEAPEKTGDEPSAPTVEVRPELPRRRPRTGGEPASEALPQDESGSAPDIALPRRKRADSPPEPSPWEIGATDAAAVPADTEPVPLSAAQQRLWRMNQDKSGVGQRVPSAWHQPFALRFTGSLDVESLGAALDDVIARHEVLRTVYPAAAESDSGPAVQRVLPAQPLPPLVARHVAAAEVSAAVRELAAPAFDVTTQLPLRARVLEISDLAPGSRREYVLILVVHRIAADESALGPIVGDLMAAYAARTANQAPRWAPLSAQYADYVRWQRTMSGSVSDPESVAAQQIAFWRSELAGLPEVLDLPGARPRPAVASLAAARTTVQIDAATHTALLELAHTHATTLFTVLQTAVAAFLARSSDTGDIAIGTSVPGRAAGEFEDLIGTFANAVVLRTRPEPAESFSDLLIRQNEVVERAFAHAELPFAGLVAELDADRSAAHHPLFQVAVSVRNPARTTVDLPGLAVEDIDAELDASEFDLHLTVTETYDSDGNPSGIDGRITYATDLFDAVAAEQLTEGLSGLLSMLVARPGQPLGRFGIGAGQEAPADREFATAVVDPVAEPGRESGDHIGRGESVDVRTLVSMFDGVAQEHAGEVGIIASAVESGGEPTRFSVGALDAHANAMARYLISLGVAPGTVVALAIRRSVDLGAAVYAVAKAGGAALSVDPEGDVERNREILAGAAPVCILADAEYAFVASNRPGGDGSFDAPTELLTPIGRTPAHRPAAGGQPTVVRVDRLNLDGIPAHRLDDTERIEPLRPDHPAWLIACAGADRVTVSHAAAVGQLDGSASEFGLDAGDRALLDTADAFDVSLWEFWSIAQGIPVQLGEQALRPRTIPELMAAAVAANPDGPAVVFRGRSFTYTQLDRASSKLARRLIQLGAAPEKAVAVAIPRSLEALVTLWSVAKTGAAVVPVEPNLPGARITDLVSDSGAVLGVTVRAAVASLPQLGTEWLVLDHPNFAAEVDAQAGEPISDSDRITSLLPDDGAYVLYGAADIDQSQGVVVAHEDLADLAEQVNHYRLHPDSRVLALAAPSSDEAVLELVLALGAAAALIVAPATIGGGPELARLIRSEHVTHAFLPESALQSVDPAALEGVEVVVTDRAPAEEFAGHSEQAASQDYPDDAAPDTVLAAPGDSLSGENSRSAEDSAVESPESSETFEPAGNQEEAGYPERVIAAHAEYPAPDEFAEQNADSGGFEATPTPAERIIAEARAGAPSAAEFDSATALSAPLREAEQQPATVASAPLPQRKPAAAAASPEPVRDAAPALPALPQRKGRQPEKPAAAPEPAPWTLESAPADDGSLPLPPRAVRLLEIDPSARDSRAIALDVPPGTAEETINSSVQALVNRHPLLTARLTVPGRSAGDPPRAWSAGSGDSAREARLLPVPTPPDITVRRFVDSEGAATMAVRVLAGELDLAQGRNIGFGLIDPSEPAETDHDSRVLVIVADGAVVDDASWRIIIEELSTAWRGRDIPDSSASAPGEVAAAMTRPMTRNSPRDGVSWWQRAFAGLPAETPLDGVDLTARGRVSLVITAEGAAAVAGVARAYHADIDDVLLTALALALVPATRAAEILGPVVRSSVDGRSLVAGSDSAIGGFTTTYPLAPTVADVDLEEALAGGAAAGAAISRVKEQRRTVPVGGAEYGVLRYLDPETAPQMSALAQGRTAFRYRDLRPARPYPDTAAADLFLDVTVDATAEGFRVRFDYASAVLTAEEIKELAGHWVRSLGGLAEHGTRPEVGGHTPSDFPLVPLTQHDLDQLRHEYPDLTDIWPVAPLQAGLLASGQRSAAAQFAVDLRGPLDERRLRLAAQAVLDRHDGLRVAFGSWAGGPVQVVSDVVNNAWRTVDFTDLRGDEASAEVERYQNADRLVPIDPHAGPLLRFAVLRSASATHRILLSAHPLLLDDRSLRLVMRDLLTVYARGPRSRQLPEVYPYRAQPAWLAVQSGPAARAVWREALSGHHAPVLLGRSDVDLEITSATGEVDIELQPAEVAELRAVTTRLGVTAQMVVQVAWGVLLGRYAECDDVVFGVAAPGRSPEVRHADSLVGRFGGIVPVRIHPQPEDSLADLLHRISEDWSARPGYYCPSQADMARSLGVDRLFDSVVMFRDDAADLAELSGIVDGVRIEDVACAPAFADRVAVTVLLNGSNRLSLRYLTEAVGDSVANLLADGLTAVMRQIAETPYTPIADLDPRLGHAPSDVGVGR